MADFIPNGSSTTCPKCAGRLMTEEEGRYCLICGWRPTVAVRPRVREPGRRGPRQRPGPAPDMGTMMNAWLHARAEGSPEDL